MATATDEQVRSGLEGVVAFATEIAEPDKEGSALRYRGVDIEDLVGNVPFEQVWGLLVDGAFLPGLPPAEPWPLTVRTGDPRVDVQAALAMLAPEWGLEQLIDISDEQARTDLARASVMALSFVAQSARGPGRPPVPQTEVDKAQSIPERFLIRWRGEADPKHVKAIDAYWTSAAEHGMNASTFTARVIASSGADAAAALSGAVGRPVGPAARRRALARAPDARRRRAHRRSRGLREALLDRGERLMGFGHRVYRAEDPRARVLRRTGREIGSPRFEVGGGAREGRARGAAGAQARPRAGHERGVLVGGGAGPRGGAARALHPDVHVRAGRRLVGAHHGAEARGPPDPPDRQVRRRAAAPRVGSTAPRRRPER